MRRQAQRGVFAGTIGARASIELVVQFERVFLLPRFVLNTSAHSAITVRFANDFEALRMVELNPGELHHASRHLSAAFVPGPVRIALRNRSARPVGVSAVFVGEEDCDDGDEPPPVESVLAPTGREDP